MTTSKADQSKLGASASRRSAELVNGLRAEVGRSPEEMALSRTMGRMFARLFIRMSSIDAARWIPSRAYAILAAARQVLPLIPAEGGQHTIVEVAAGFSPRALWLAREYPNAQVIEVDLPDMVAEKRARLQKASIPLPPNLSWRTADLSETALLEVLEGRPAHLLLAEGLLVYFAVPALQRALQQFHAALVPGGALVCDIFDRKLLNEVRASKQLGPAAALFLRQVGNTPGLASDEAETLEWALTAGFAEASADTVGNLAVAAGHPRPTMEMARILTARRGTA